MNAKDYFKKICTHAAYYFTAATLLLILFYIIFSMDLTRGIHPGAQALLLPFALLFATANVQYKYAGYSMIYRVCIHYLLTVVGAFCLLYLPNRQGTANASQGLILYIALTLFYAIVMGVVIGVAARAKKVKRDGKAYRQLYHEEEMPKNSASKKKNDDYQNVFKK